MVTFDMKQNNKGFSLIELSIVLIIMGILIVGIIRGVALYNQSKMITLNGELNAYVNATQQFVYTYNSLPGLLPNASQKIEGVTDTTKTDLDTQYINEDNNVLDQNSLAFFQQLSYAGFLDEVRYNGGKKSNGGTVSSIDDIDKTTYPFSRAFKNTFFYVRGDSVGGSYNQINRISLYNKNNKNIMNAKLLSILDTKFDDGLPLTGHISVIPSAID